MKPRLAHFEVLSPLGAGGMGEVFRARDTKLGRDVALKVLAGALAESPERRARLEREARLLATLNHPGIATIHGLEDDAGTPVLVMELVEGETLDQRLDRGPLPVRQALEVGRQIAEGLEAAHEKGIIHRDLKPSNVKLTPEGKVKLLDFGLAKALGVEVASSSDATLTTPSDDSTGSGVVLGTAPYMSPEQACGEELDRRTDIWSFGCVLYEMLAGKRAFLGRTRSDAIAAVLEQEPDWEKLPAAAPHAAAALLRRCLRKEKRERLRDVGDARIELQEALEFLSAKGTRPATEPPSVPTLGASTIVVSEPARHRRKAAVWLAGLCLAGAAALAVWLLRSASLAPPGLPNRLTFAPPPSFVLLTDARPSQHLALSADGDAVVFVAESGTNHHVYLRKKGEIQAKELPDTDRAANPFFSPDGRWIGFSQDGQLRKMSLDGGAPVAICDLPGAACRGASWGPDGRIVFVPKAGALGLWLVSSDGGGTPRQLTAPDPAKGETHAWPQILPGGRAALFVIRTSIFARDARIAVVDLASGRSRVLVEGSGFARYSSSGHVLYAKLGTVFVVPFDTAQLTITGPALPVLDDVQMSTQGGLYADFNTSDSGALIYVPGFSRAIARSLFRVDREGRAEVLSPVRRPYSGPVLSPEGRRLLVTVVGDLGVGDMWALDLERDTWVHLLPGVETWRGLWAPDGRSVAFVASASGDQVMTIPADASRPAVAVGPRLGNANLDAWSPDGQHIVFTQGNSSQGRGWDLGVLPLRGPAEPRLLLAEKNAECCAALSPDGRWMAYVSDEAGDCDVYLRPFPGPGEKHRVATDGGIQPRWSRDGRELFFRWRGARPKLMGVWVETRGGLRVGRPRPLFDDTFFLNARDVPAEYDVALDGRFVFVEEPVEAPAPRQLVLIPDFAREVKEKLRAVRH